MADVPMSDEELFPHPAQHHYLQTLPEVDQENVRAWKRIVNAMSDRATVHNDGVTAIRGILTPMQLRAIAAIAAFNHSVEHGTQGKPCMFDLFRVRETK